jgi:hypothetical protein
LTSPALAVYTLHPVKSHTPRRGPGESEDRNDYGERTHKTSPTAAESFVDREFVRHRKNAVRCEQTANKETLMSKKSRITITGVLACSALLLVVAPAWAGMSYYSQVEVYVAGPDSYASGTPSSARASADTTQYIGCDLDASKGGQLMAECHAMDSAGTEAWCSTQDPALVEVIKTVTPSTFVWFHGNGGECATVYVSRDGRYLP